MGCCQTKKASDNYIIKANQGQAQQIQRPPTFAKNQSVYQAGDFKVIIRKKDLSMFSDKESYILQTKPLHLFETVSSYKIFQYPMTNNTLINVLDKRLGLDIEPLKKLHKKQIGESTYYIDNDANDTSYLIQKFNRQQDCLNLAQFLSQLDPGCFGKLAKSVVSQILNLLINTQDDQILFNMSPFQILVLSEDPFIVQPLVLLEVNENTLAQNEFLKQRRNIIPGRGVPNRAKVHNILGLAMLSYFIENNGLIPQGLYENYEKIIQSREERVGYLKRINRDNPIYYFFLENLEAPYDKLLKNLQSIDTKSQYKTDTIVKQVLKNNTILLLQDLLLDAFTKLDQKKQASIRSQMIQSLRGFQVQKATLQEFKDFSSKLIGNPDDIQLFKKIDQEFYEQNLKEIRIKVFCFQFFSIVDAYEKQNRDKFGILEKQR